MWQNVKKNVKCGDIVSDAGGNAKLMVIFFSPNGLQVNVLTQAYR